MQNMRQRPNYAGYLRTPITSGRIFKKILIKLPVYKGLSRIPRLRSAPISVIRGFEIGLAHGYFLIGPFYKLSPLRNSNNALLIGCLATIGLSIFLNIGIVTYGFVTFNNKKSMNTFLAIIPGKRYYNKNYRVWTWELEKGKCTVQNSVQWKKLNSGILMGLCSSCIFASLLIKIFA